jgi:hypothetical protein
MAGSIRNIALTKQLMEKAQEAAKQKKASDDAIGIVHAIVQKAKEREISLTEVEPLNKEIEKKAESKSWSEVPSLVEKFKAAASPFLEEFVTTSASQIQENCNLAKISGVRLPPDVDAFSKHVAAKEYADAFVMIDRIREETAREIRNEATNSVAQVEKTADVLRGLGKDPAELLAAAKEAREALDQGFVSAALEKVAGAIAKVETAVKGEVERIARGLEGAERLPATTSLDVSRSKESLAEARRLLESRDLNAAVARARDAEKLAQEACKAALPKVLREVSSGLEEAKKYDAQTDKAERLVGEARERAQAGDFLQGVRALSDALREIGGAKQSRLLDAIGVMVNKFRLAQKVKANLSEPVSLLNQAREAFQRGDFRRAMELTEMCDQLVSKLVGELESLYSEVQALEAVLNEAHGFGVDVGPLKTRLDLTKSILEEKDFAKAKMLLTGVRRDLDRTLNQAVMERVEKAGEALRTGEKVGLKLEGVSKQMEEAVALMNQRKYQEAVQLAQKASEKGQEEVHKYIEDLLLSAESAITLLPEESQKKLKELHKKAEDAIRAGREHDLWELGDRIKGFMDEVAQRDAKEQVRQAREYMDILRRMKGKDDALEKKFEQAVDEATKKNFGAALRLASAIIEEARKHEKEIAEEAFNSAKASLVDVRKLGIDIESVRGLLQQARKELDSGEFRVSFEHSMQCRREALKKREVFQNAYDAISTAASAVAEAKMKGLDIREMAKTLIKSKNLFKAKKYEEARKLAEDSKQVAESMLLLYKASEELSRLNNVVAIGTENGLDMVRIVEKVGRVKAQVDSGNAQSALDLVKEADLDSNGIFSQYANVVLSEAVASIDEAEKNGLSIQGIKQMAERATQALGQNDAFEAFHYATLANKEIKRVKDSSTRANDLIKTAYKRINEVESYHADSSAAKAYLNQAIKFFKLGDFERASEFGQKSVEEAEVAENRLLTRVISNVQEAISKAKREGTSTVVAENLLNQSKTALAEKNYREALNLAMKAEGELERVGLQQEMATTTMTVTEAKIGKLRQEGFVSEEADRLMAKAKESFDMGEYIRALDLAIQAGEVIHKFSEAFRDVREEFVRVQQVLELLDRAGLPRGAAGERFEAASKEFKAGNYLALKDSFASLAAGVRDEAKASRKSLVDYASWVIDIAGTLGVDSHEAKRFFEEAVAEFERSLVDQGITALRSCLAAVDPGIREALGMALDELARKVEEEKAKGVSIAKPQGLAEAARAAMKTGRYREAHEAVVQSLAALEKAVEAGVRDSAAAAEEQAREEQYKSLVSEVEAGIEAGRKFGFKVETIAQGVAAGKNLWEEGKRADALASLRSTAAETEKLMEKFTPSVKGSLSPPAQVEEGISAAFKVKLSNDAKAVAKAVEAVIEGPVEGASLKLPTLKAGGVYEETVNLRFSANGDVKIKLKVTFLRAIDDRKYENVAETVVKVAPKPSLFAEPFAATMELKCQNCGGKIKAGMLMLKCSCEAPYHEPCAVRTDKCKKCGKDMLKPKKSKEKLALTFG